jgi:hypothetical protein
MRHVGGLGKLQSQQGEVVGDMSGLEIMLSRLFFSVSVSWASLLSVIIEFERVVSRCKTAKLSAIIFYDCKVLIRTNKVF